MKEMSQADQAICQMSLNVILMTTVSHEALSQDAFTDFCGVA